MTRTQLKLYRELATWFHLLTAPEDYGEEARFYRRTFHKYAKRRPKTVLELGCGGGNNAWHMKRWFQMTLTDLSEDMLELSRSINPQCEHVQGDMRRLRLGREFDAVFVHDAVMYMTTERDLRAAMQTAFEHCRPGGVALFAPDCTSETFQPETTCGGHDRADGRGLRYVQWMWVPGSSAGAYNVDFAYLLRGTGGRLHVEQDRHVFGLFGRRDWLRLMREAGFRARSVRFEHSESGRLPVFVGVRP